MGYHRTGIYRALVKGFANLNKFQVRSQCEKVFLSRVFKEMTFFCPE